jgi:hypothetical protein
LICVSAASAIGYGAPAGTGTAWIDPRSARSAGAARAERHEAAISPGHAEGQQASQARPGGAPNAHLGAQGPGDVERDGPAARDLQAIAAGDRPRPQTRGGEQSADEGPLAVPVRDVDAEPSHQPLGTFAPSTDRRRLENAKDELRRVFGRPTRSPKAA